MNPPLHVFFLRHGETAWSLSGRHTGRTDLPLTANGEQMASALRPALAEIAFSHVMTSPQMRARRTCELAGLGPSATIDPDLAEWDYGEYEGLRSAEIRREHPGWDVWQDGCPGGETLEDLAARAQRVIARLRALSGTVALFSHGQFGRALAARWIGLDAREGQHFALDPASISVLGFDLAHPDRPVISLWNATPASLRGPFA